MFFFVLGYWAGYKLIFKVILLKVGKKKLVFFVFGSIVFDFFLVLLVCDIR